MTAPMTYFLHLPAAASSGDGGACACPNECDCEDYENGLVSNECPVHNLYPRPAMDCPVHGEA
jgi:hypothetical protein